MDSLKWSEVLVSPRWFGVPWHPNMPWVPWDGVPCRGMRRRRWALDLATYGDYMVIHETMVVLILHWVGDHDDHDHDDDDDNLMMII